MNKYILLRVLAAMHVDTRTARGYDDAPSFDVSCELDELDSYIEYEV